jgi:hypothetical protein
MSSVPLSMQKLEEITILVAQELLEDWAINDRFDENEMDQAKENAVNDTILIINSFMEKFNEVMILEATEKKLIN